MYINKNDKFINKEEVYQKLLRPKYFGITATIATAFMLKEPLVQNSLFVEGMMYSVGVGAFTQLAKNVVGRIAVTVGEISFGLYNERQQLKCSNSCNNSEIYKASKRGGMCVGIPGIIGSALLAYNVASEQALDILDYRDWEIDRKTLVDDIEYKGIEINYGLEDLTDIIKDDIDSTNTELLDDIQDIIDEATEKFQEFKEAMEEKIKQDSIRRAKPISENTIHFYDALKLM